MSPHESAVAAFLAQSASSDPARHASVIARYPTASHHVQPLDEGRLDTVAVRYGTSEFRDFTSVPAYVDGEGCLQPPPTIAAMNQRRANRARAKRRRPGPQRTLAAPWYPLDRPVVLTQPR